MSDIKISVIIPVYKVEEQLRRAVDSIFAQTFTEFELFLVDDGSPDGSGAICDEYGRMDARVRVIHKQNGGAPSARNIAMDVARGEYLYFMDGDDWTEPEMLYDMYTLAKGTNAQLVVAGYFDDTVVGETEYFSLTVSAPDALYLTREAFRKNAYDLFDKSLLYAPWNKLYLRSYIEEKGLRFPKTLWDDLPFNLSVIRDVERVAVTKKSYYHFLRERADSETAKYVEALYEKREEEHGWLIELYNYWDQHDANSREFLARRYLDRLIGCVANLTNPKCTIPEAQKYFRVKKMLGSPRLKACLRHARPRSTMMRLMLLPYRLKSARLALLQSQFIALVKAKNARLFAKLKAYR
ncbi:MAG: glycosyltransferase family 2 protein [Clostridiaceae bacterium]|nr:glycosyltransferase [Eubacteriales bacterium]